MAFPTSRISTMLSFSSVTTQTSWLPPTTSSAKAVWPNPELSIGRECESFGRNKCWEVAGPAQEFSERISPKVKELLDSRNEYLYEKEPVTDVAVIFGFYMIGRSEENSNPTLLFICARKKPRQKALKIVMESGLVSRYGVLLAQSARSPLSPQGSVPRPVVPLASDQSLLGKSESTFDIYFARSTSLSTVPCGMLIHIQGNQDDSTSSRNATIGGLIYSENEKLERTYYGITAAHVFAPGARDNEALREDYSNEEDDAEFAFYGQENDIADEDDEFIEATSRGEAIMTRGTPITNLT